MSDILPFSARCGRSCGLSLSEKFACTIMQDGSERDLGIVDDIYINELLTAGYHEI